MATNSRASTTVAAAAATTEPSANGAWAMPAQHGASERAVPNGLLGLMRYTSHATKCRWEYLVGAVNALAGDSMVLVAPTVSTFVMNGHLRMIAVHVDRKRHLVPGMDQGGRHVVK